VFFADNPDARTLTTTSLDNLDMRCILYLDNLEERNEYEFCR